MASAARRPEGFVRSNRREGAQTRDAPSGLEVRFEEMSRCRCFEVFRSSNAVSGRYLRDGDYSDTWIEVFQIKGPGAGPERLCSGTFGAATTYILVGLVNGAVFGSPERCNLICKEHSP
jgi:hypothetical protein